jgi:FtsP/CotA-like multicopper oxidase with cupredoxin domain
MNKRVVVISITLALVLLAFVWGTGQGQAAPILNPAVDLSKPNFAYSPPLRKFMDSLPGLTSAGTNSLGQFIPVATPGTLGGFPNDDYYEIALVEYHEQLHRDLPAVTGVWPNQTGGTTLRGYVQLVQGTSNFVSPPHYLGPLIIAQKNRPVRIKFVNMLPLTASGGDLFLPVDATIMGAGMGPKTAGGADCDPASQACASYTQNRATLHLHGGLPPWISDGTAHQWITPAGETTPFVKGASQQNVPDMALPPAGSATFYWPNQQSGRLMFYHDHALGITGLNVYAGEAAGYLLSDPAEETALANLGVPGTTADLGHLIPLVIQDKSFVYDNSITPVGVAKDATRFTAVTDPLWDAVNWGGGGNLWFPHVYEPNQDPTVDEGANPLGRWDYGPWFWPIFLVDSPYPPTVSHVPEAFMDTPLVNGTAYPFINVDAAPYRLKILNACNDRMVNLQMYVADAAYTTAATGTALISAGSVSTITVVNPGSGYPANSSPMVHIVGGGGFGAWATATVNGSGNVTAIVVADGGYDYTSPPTIIVGGSTEVKMVPAIPNAAIPFPPLWKSQTPGMTPDILDERLSGVPDPTLRGPAFVQIGTEGGLLPGPVVIPNTPVGYEQNKRNIVVLNVLEKSLFMAPAERADVIVDFSQFAGKTIILYNDSPAPVPASDPRYDFYTGNPDYSATGGVNDQGGAPPTMPGYGPNTRTILQFRVAGSGGIAPVDDVPAALVSALTTSLPVIFKALQDAPIVPESDYNSLLYSGGSTSNTFARIQDLSLTFTPYNATAPITVAMKNKTIQELFDPQGRMNATLGVELPFTNAGNQTTVPLGFIDPVTETLASGKTQLWKITHNGVDTHGIHFHLVNVQVVNRVGWDGAIRQTDANELGWKDTVRMNPLEDIIVAMRAKTPTFPFAIPDSIRPLNPAMPVGSTFASFDPITGNPTTVTNDITNFGWEYTWHCHILGHEENDMMRALVLKGNDRVGIVTNGDWYLDASGNNAWDGTPNDKLNSFIPPVANGTPVWGDWDGSGTSKIGIYKDGIWYVDLNGNGIWDGTPTDAQYSFGIGIPNAIPVTGDWNGSGPTKIGVYINGTWYLDLNGNGAWDGTPTDARYSFGIGVANAIPVTGDWTGTGTTKIGIYKTGSWYVDLNGNGAWDGTPTDALYSFGGGIANAIPVTGDWTGNGKTKIGIYTNGTWYSDLDGNGAWDGPSIDAQYLFGNGVPGAVPVIGKW